MIVSLFKYKVAAICIWVCIQTSASIYVIPGRCSPDGVYDMSGSVAKYMAYSCSTLLRCVPPNWTTL